MKAVLAPSEDPWRLDLHPLVLRCQECHVVQVIQFTLSCHVLYLRILAHVST